MSSLPHLRAPRPGKDGTVLLGREQELRRLDGHLAAIRARAGTAVALVGDPGIGKTALLQWAAAEATGMRVLRATGVESEVELAFSGLAELCLPLLEHLGEIPPPQRTALSGAFALEAGSSEDRFALAMGAVSLVQAAARTQPVLLLVDDAQWLDRASADALRFVMRRVHDQPVGAIVATRRGEFDVAGIETIEVRGLPDDAALELLARSADVDAAVARELVALTAGNPLALTELARTHAADDPGERRFHDEPVRVGPTIERAFARQIDQLSADAQE